MGHPISERDRECSFLVLQYQEYGDNSRIAEKGVLID